MPEIAAWPGAQSASPAALRTAQAALIFAVSPAELGGVCVRAAAGPQRDAWCAALRRLLPAGTPWCNVPLHISDDRLFGGLDLAATLRAGRPVAEPGLIDRARGGLMVVPMAERLSAGVAARLAAALDAAATQTSPAARVALLLQDEGDDAADAPEQPPAALLDRCALWVDLRSLRWCEADCSAGDDSAQRDFCAQVQAAAARLPQVQADDTTVQRLCDIAWQLGIASMRAPLMAVRVACIAAALDGRLQPNDDDVALAAQLVLAPRAQVLPESAADDSDAAASSDDEELQDTATPEATDKTAPPEEHDSDAPSAAPPPDSVLGAVKAAIPAGLLARLQLQATRARTLTGGHAGALRPSGRRGRP
ncbi:MAG: magnesium chelatase ATPase subunit D, partial [Betaproteobacteria bacterium]|nr:magnesium chelatase ATPase subunit D [Betaproteobacteria bacterium]